MNRFALVSVALLIVACGGGAPTTPGPGATQPPAGATQPPAGATQPPAGATQPPAGTSASDITVTLTGGQDAGTYEAHPTEVTCSRGLTGEGSWGNQYSVADFDGFSSLQLIVDDRQDAADGTAEFQVTIGMGVLFGSDYREYTINTRPDAQTRIGAGAVTITDAGSTATVAIVGQNDSGVAIAVTIVCNQIIGS